MNALKLWLPIEVVLSLCAGVVLGCGVYYKAVADVRNDLSVLRLEREREYVKKVELAEMQKDIKQLIQDTADIKGYLKARK